jgi:dihydrodipicolinate synthase/N-acetylneuraminate lyase
MRARPAHLAATIELAQYAERIGYYGIQVSVPYYWTTSDGDAVAWYGLHAPSGGC